MRKAAGALTIIAGMACWARLSLFWLTMVFLLMTLFLTCLSLFRLYCLLRVGSSPLRQNTGKHALLRHCFSLAFSSFGHLVSVPV